MKALTKMEEAINTIAEVRASLEMAAEECAAEVKPTVSRALFLLHLTASNLEYACDHQERLSAIEHEIDAAEYLRDTMGER